MLLAYHHDPILYFILHHSIRWVCTSAMPADLEVTDNLAVTVLENIIKQGGREIIDDHYNIMVKYY